MHLRLALALLLASCAGDRAVLSDGAGGHVRRDFCCMERDDAPGDVLPSAPPPAG